MSGGNIMIRFKAIDASGFLYEPVDTGFMKLKTKRFGTADEIETKLWDEITNDYHFKQHVRRLAEQLAAAQTVIGKTEFRKQEEEYEAQKKREETLSS